MKKIVNLSLPLASCLILGTALVGCEAADECADPCSFDQRCIEGECAFLPCDATGDVTTCETEFNAGFECKDVDGAFLCMSQEGYCDDAVPCTGTDVCHPIAFGCVSDQFCDADLPCGGTDVCDSVTSTCQPPDACSGDEDCATDGQYCDVDVSPTACETPNDTCHADLNATPPSFANGPVLYGLAELSLGVGEADESYAEDGLDSPAGFGWCSASSTNFPHAWRVNYYDPNGAFPIVADDVKAVLAVFKTIATADQQAPNAIAVNANMTVNGGQFVFYLCLGSSSVGDSWALQYDDGTDISSAACFDIATETHVCTGAGC